MPVSFSVLQLLLFLVSIQDKSSMMYSNLSQPFTPQAFFLLLHGLTELQICQDIYSIMAGNPACIRQNNPYEPSVHTDF